MYILKLLYWFFRYVIRCPHSFYVYINNESSLFQALDQSRRAKKAGEQRNSNRAKNGGKREGESLSQVERTLAYPSYTGRANRSYISLQTRGPEPFTGETKSWLGQRGGPPSSLRQTANGKRQTCTT